MSKIENLSIIYYKSPIGYLKVTASAIGICRVEFCRGANSGEGEKTPVMDLVKTQLDEYFSGSRQEFDIAFDIKGTEFQHKVWNALSSVGYGELKSYKEIATIAGNNKASRAVGMACNKNPLPIIVPCHRIVATSGGLTGYAGGIEKKKWLLEFENVAF